MSDARPERCVRCGAEVYQADAGPMQPATDGAWWLAVRGGALVSCEAGEDPARRRWSRHACIWAALDFETASHRRDSACSMAIVRVVGDEFEASRHWYVRPPGSEWTNEAVHRIPRSAVANAPSMREVWAEALPMLEGCQWIAAHNAAFDRDVLLRSGGSWGGGWIDTVKVAKRTWSLPRYALNNVTGFLGIELEHHEALSDARACAEILLRAMQKPGWDPREYREAYAR